MTRWSRILIKYQGQENMDDFLIFGIMQHPLSFEKMASLKKTLHHRKKFLMFGECLNKV